MRGTRDQHREGASFQGIIPACAGNTGRGRDAGAARRDHPRVCGEHSLPCCSASFISGSSPRVRGTPEPECPRIKTVGIIPACAGNTRASRPGRPCARDHPRVCGEHLVLAYRATIRSGSSPRVRGTPGRGVHAASRRGIIPACAGNTWSWRTAPPRGRDHPRVCGEHVPDMTGAFQTEGSSPRVRGTRIRVNLRRERVGIIPACAGNTPTSRWTRRPTRDHPRVCGEHSRKSQFKIP